MMVMIRTTLIAVIAYAYAFMAALAVLLAVRRDAVTFQLRPQCSADIPGES
jgi:hypothetical protein